MTDTNALRVALLTELGWRKGVTARRGFTGEIWVRGEPTTVEERIDMPPLDHNLIAEARQGLLVTDELKLRYVQRLHVIVNGCNNAIPNWCTFTATPDQHAAAILFALGKLTKDWRESAESKPLIIL